MKFFSKLLFRVSYLVGIIKIWQKHPSFILKQKFKAHRKKYINKIKHFA